MCGETGDPVADREVVDALAQRQHHAGQFVAEAGRQLGRRAGQVLPPEHVVPADADRLDAHQHLAGGRLRARPLLEPEHFGRAELVKTNDAGHRLPRLQPL
ncbi:hypothetical protein D3C75_1126680 [compost metagenome]